MNEFEPCICCGVGASSTNDKNKSMRLVLRELERLAYENKDYQAFSVLFGFYVKRLPSCYTTTDNLVMITGAAENDYLKVAEYAKQIVEISRNNKMTLDTNTK